MKVSFYMLLYRAFHAQRKCLRPFMAELGLAPGQPKVLLYLAGTMAVCRRTSRSTVTLSRPQQAVCWIHWKKTVLLSARRWRETAAQAVS